MRVILALGEVRGGYGRGTFSECLESLEGQHNSVNPATCASGESNVGNVPQTDPRQVVSPSSNQTLPQEPLHMQDQPRLEAYLGPEEAASKCKEEETPKREEFDVKEEPVSPGLREGEATQPSQPSVATGAVRRPRNYNLLPRH